MTAGVGVTGLHGPQLNAILLRSAYRFLAWQLRARSQHGATVKLFSTSIA